MVVGRIWEESGSLVSVYWTLLADVCVLRLYIGCLGALSEADVNSARMELSSFSASSSRERGFEGGDSGAD